MSSTAIHVGLGFNMDIRGEWEFKMAAAAGATEARFQPGWSTAQNMAGAFALSKDQESALSWCATYGIKPLLVAGYGPPFQSLGKFTVARACPIGSTTIPLNGPVDSLVVPYCHIKGVGNLQIVREGKWGYYGALITDVDPATHSIKLAAATSIALDADQPLVINKLLYPSCATADPSDPSIVAYGKYTAFLADRIAAHGISGRVELWNEPGWAHDPWDHRGQFYDNVPSGITTGSPNFGFAEHLAPTTLPAGVRYNWGGTNKSGSRSVLNPKFMSPPITAEEVANSISCEAMHPYGNNPEDHLWLPATLAAADTHHVDDATLPGESRGSNMKFGYWMNLQNPSLHFKQNVTETGKTTVDNVKKARFVIRQYLGMLADGFERVTFFQFAAAHASSIESFGFVDATTQAPTIAYTAVKGLVVDDVKEMPAAPVKSATADLPTISSYSGTYPLTSVSILGRQADADGKNSIDFVAWQRSMVPPGPVTNLAVISATNHIKLSWSANTYSVETTLQRSTVSGGPYTVIASHLNGGYTDSAATAGTTYHYVVVGANPGGESSNSNEVSGTPAADGKGKFDNNSRPAGPEQIDWLKLPSPAAAQVLVHLPVGYKATKAWDLVTRAEVPISIKDDEASYAVADNPISLRIVPSETATRSASH